MELGSILGCVGHLMLLPLSLSPLCLLVYEVWVGGLGGKEGPSDKGEVDRSSWEVQPHPAAPRESPEVWPLQSAQPHRLWPEYGTATVPRRSSPRPWLRAEGRRPVTRGPTRLLGPTHRERLERKVGSDP